MILGANPPLCMYAAGSGFADIFFNQATDEQKKWAAICAQRGWGATMVLTEPDAGSDVGAGRTKAVEQPDGTWHIDGVKRFITSGDQDMTENIFHLVLACPEGAGPGTKGLSLFFVPKFHFDHETGELGERNGVFVTNVEHKMGIKASATCEVTFGQHGVPAKGWLVGEVHKGRHRADVRGHRACPHDGGHQGHLHPVDRLPQRPRLRQAARPGCRPHPDDRQGRPARHHHPPPPDVRRSLMTQKAYAEGLRAVYLYTASHQDAAAAKIVSGADADLAHRVNDLLLPIVKVSAPSAYAALSHESLQTFGGSGFLQDYPIEQYIRDAKIDSLYEGTTAIQAQDFFFRKIVRDRGQAFRPRRRPDPAVHRHRSR